MFQLTELRRRSRSRHAHALSGALATVASTILAISGATTSLAAPAQMTAIVQQGYGGPQVLHIQQIPTPQPARGQVRVRVYAAGVNPFDWMGRLRAPANATASGTPLIPGGEIAGRIDALGPGVTQFKVGEAVYGRFARIRSGYAQYAVIDADSIAPKPKGFSFEQAAAAAEAGRTAVHVIDDAHLHSGETVVVIGAAGGEGSAFVQLAKAHGARVVAVASSEHNVYLKSLGADQIVNYDQGNPSPRTLQGADVVINTVGSQAGAALGYARRGGLLLTIAGTITPAQCEAAGVSCPNEEAGAYYPRSVAALLTELNRLVDSGQYTVHIQKAFPLTQAGEAEEFNRAGHAEGKVVLDVTAQARER